MRITNLIEIICICLAFQTCLFASKDTGPSLQLQDLQELKIIYFDKEKSQGLSREERQRLFAKINSATEKDETIILSFIKTELMNLKITGDDDYKKIDYILIPLCKQLREVGGKNTVELFFQWLSQSNWNPEVGLPLRLADTIMQISGRVQIQEEKLLPLMDSKNQNFAALATQMHQCLSYNDVPLNIEGIIRYGVSKRDALNNSTLKMHNWRTIASERGFTLNRNVSTEALLKLAFDCDKRISDIQKKIKEGTLGYQESKHIKDWEDLFRFCVITELVKSDKEKAFDYLVSKMEQGDGGESEAYFLYDMTGNHFPTYGYISYPRWGSNGVDLTRKAAAAWREWRKSNTLGGLTSSQKDAIELEKRLGDFRLNRKSTDQRENLRPTDEVIDEMLSTSDKRVQEMLIEVMSSKTLTEEQVQRIIQASAISDSEAHRIALWKVLWTSGESDARTYVKTVVNKNTAEENVIKFLEPITTVGMADVAFLDKLYFAHPSALVKDRIVQIASDKAYNYDNEAQFKLIELIVQNSNDDEHKLSLLWSAYRRSGINARGRSIVTEALKNEESPVVKKAIYEKIILNRPESGLRLLLDNEETEEITLTGLAEFKKAMLEGRVHTRSFDTKLLKVLIRVAGHNPSSKVKSASEVIVAEVRKKDIEEIVNRQERILTQIEMMAKVDKENGELAKEIKSQLEMIYNSPMYDFMVSKAIEELKEKYGKLPEEETFKSELKKARENQKKLIKQILDAAADN